MDLITRIDFDAVAATDRYYANSERWDLYEAAIGLIEQLGPVASDVLELGPYKLPLVKGCDTMDIRHRPTIKWDATEFQWPIEDGRYDLFIGLQVFEHLGDRQVFAWREVRRIANHAILSFPFCWDCPTNKSHHMVTSQTVSRWTEQYEAESIQVIASKTDHRRILYRFDF